jgi:hypothetical protein
MNQYLYGHITHARGCGGVPREASGRCCGAGYRACDITKLPPAHHHNPPHKTRRICTNLEIVFFGPPGGTHTQPTPGGRSATPVGDLGHLVTGTVTVPPSHWQEPEASHLPTSTHATLSLFDSHRSESRDTMTAVGPCCRNNALARKKRLCSVCAGTASGNLNSRPGRAGPQGLPRPPLPLQQALLATACMPTASLRLWVLLRPQEATDSVGLGQQLRELCVRFFFAVIKEQHGGWGGTSRTGTLSQCSS